MAINLNDNIQVLAGKSTDARYLDNLTPYANISAVNAGIASNQRYSGLTVNINTVEYWYKDGIGDVDLVMKESNIATQAITGATNGLTKTGQDVILGGSLTGNVCITGSYALTADVTTLNLSGVSTSIGGTVTFGTIPSGSGGLLCRDASIGEICQTSLTALGAITGATNGITDCGSQQLGFGGTLCANTVVSGTQTLTLGDLNGICLSTANTNDIALNAKSNGGVVIKSQSGTVASSTDFTDAVGILTDFNAASGFAIYDNRSTATGIVYAANYSTSYVDRSLVDKGYVDTVASGLDPKSAVLVATTENITLSGTQTIDGVSLVAGDRILVKDQTSGATNGIYVVTGGTWSRSSDFDGAPTGEVTEGALIPVLSGSTNINSAWILITKNPITIGTTDLEFTKFSQLLAISAGAGIAIGVVGETNTVCVDLGSDSGLNTSSGLVIDSSVAGNALSFSSGVLSVNAESCGSVGGISVGYNTGDCLVVACSDLITALGTPINTANNGLTKVGSNVVLGGALTGDTTISGAHTLCLSSLTAFNATATNIALIGAVAVTGAATVSDTLAVTNGTDLNGILNVAGAVALQSTVDITGATTIGGAIDANSTANISGAVSLQSTFDVTGATTLGNILDVTGAIDAESSLDILGATTLHSTLTVTGNTDITSGTLDVGGVLTLDTVNVGSVSTDTILVRDSGGIIKEVAADTLSEDNNRYTVEVVTTNITLPTSGYTIFISGATTITLPAGTDGMAFKIKDVSGDALANSITIVGTIDGDTNALINTDYGALELVYSSDLSGWFSLAFIN